MKKTRYLGVQPYSTLDKDLFFGRDADIDNLYDLLMLEKLIVLFGKSGYGKTSLINAGLIPRITDTSINKSYRFFPIEIRFGHYLEGVSISPLDTVRSFIDKIPTLPSNDFWGKLEEDESLWLKLKRRQGPSRERFVLLFDQFEELFTYPIRQQELFRNQLAELLYAEFPNELREKVELFPTDQLEKATQTVKTKVMISIRSDLLSLLDTMKDVIPTILHKRYELKKLNRDQARSAIIEPARLGNETHSEFGHRFSTSVFEFSEPALAKIEQELSSGLEAGIEAFQLQIVCVSIEKEVFDGKVQDIGPSGFPTVSTDNLPDFKHLYNNYYKDKLLEIDEGKRLGAQLVFENGLLSIDPISRQGRRMSVDSRSLLSQYSKNGLTQEMLNELERTYLIRKEVNSVGGFNYEISHDSLIKAVLDSRENRRMEKRERIKAQKRSNLIIAIIVPIILYLILTLWFSIID